MSASNLPAVRILLSLVALGFICVAAFPPALGQQTGSFRVCADPNNLPFSNQTKEGLEDKLADLIAADFAEPVTYVWHAQRRGFFRETLNAEACDVVMGVPKLVEAVITTRPYYRSTYVFVSRADHNLDIASITDPRLKQLRIGVQLLGADGFNTPPSHALAAQGMAGNLAGYPVYGDYSEPNPPARIVTAVEQRQIDIAAVWGPLAGYFAKQSPVPLVLTPITGTGRFAPLRFQYDIAIGVRKNDHGLRAKLDDVLARKHNQITTLLESYGIPLVAATSELTNGIAATSTK